MNKVDYSEWKVFSERMHSCNYKNADETKILKTGANDFVMSLEDLEHEKRISKEVLSMNVKTPDVYEILEDPTNKGYAIIYQNIKNKKSISRALSEDLTQMDYLAKLFAEYLRKLHATKCTSTYFTPYTDSIRDFIATTKLYSEERRTLLLKLLDMCSKYDMCLHGDCNASNFILANGEVYAIDLSFFTKGCPYLDIGTLYIFCCHMPEAVITKMFHVSPATMKEFWNHFVPYYIDSNDENKIKEFNDKIFAYGFLGLAKHASHLANPIEYINIMNENFEKAFEWVKNA